MATLFDFFIDRDRRRYGQDPVTERDRMLLGRPPDRQTVRDINSLMNQVPPPDRTTLAPPVSRPDFTGSGSDVPVADPTLRVAAPPRPNYTPDQRLSNIRSDVRGLENSPVTNNDRGVLGRLGDIFRQAIVSAGSAYDRGQGSPTERLMGAAGAGIAGGAYGGFHPQVDEERQRLYDIAKLRDQEGRIVEQQKVGGDIAYQQAQAELIRENARLAGPKLSVEAARVGASGLEAARDHYRKLYDGLVSGGGFYPDKDDPKYNPEHEKIRDAAQAEARTMLPRREPGEQYSFHTMGDGSLIAGNKRTGETEVRGKFEKPADAGDLAKALPDEMFGLVPDADLRSQAAANAMSTGSRKVEFNPTIMNELMNYIDPAGERRYRNDDGTFNQNQVLTDMRADMFPFDKRDLFRTTNEEGESDIAKAEAELRKDQQSKAQEVSMLRSRLGSNRPYEGAAEMPAAELVTRFNAIMNLKNPTQREKLLKVFYDGLPNFNIRY